MMHKSMRRNRKRSGTKRSGTKRSGSKRGGMFRQDKKKAMLSDFYTSPEGMPLHVRSELLAGPFSASYKFLAENVFKSSVDAPKLTTTQKRLMDETSSSLETKMLTALPDEICKSAERLRATSFRSKNLEKCAELNVRAMEQLRRAAKMGSLRARACFADMLFGNTVGFNQDFQVVKLLVCQDPPACKGFLAYEDDPDCKGVLAHYCFKNGLPLKYARDLAEQSAAAGSKYGQLVLGLLLERDSKPDLAINFKAAAAQNYDEAQIALSELHSKRGDKAEALRLLNLAAEQGNKNAFFSIAQIYSSDAAQNAHSFREAERWFKLAQKTGHPYAEDMLKGMKSRSGFGRG